MLQHFFFSPIFLQCFNETAGIPHMIKIVIHRMCKAVFVRLWTINWPHNKLMWSMIFIYDAPLLIVFKQLSTLWLCFYIQSSKNDLNQMHDSLSCSSSSFINMPFNQPNLYLWSNQAMVSGIDQPLVFSYLMWVFADLHHITSLIRKIYQSCSWTW